MEISLEKLDPELLKRQIHALITKLKTTDARFEYGKLNITKLNIKIEDMKDDIYREELKIKWVSDELDETFDDILSNYWTAYFWRQVIKQIVNNVL